MVPERSVYDGGEQEYWSMAKAIDRPDDVGEGLKGDSES